MTHIFKDKIYDINLISKIKKKIGSKELKNIRNHLKNLTELDIKECNELKVKTFDDEEEIKIVEENKKEELKISSPVISLRVLTKYLKKSNSKINKNYKEDEVEENTPSTIIDNDEEIVQIDSSDFSADD